MSKQRNVSIYEDIARLGMSEPDIAVPHTATYGQCAEDIIVLAALRAIGFAEGIDLSLQTYLEIGANHPVATSATWLLYNGLGMRGVLVEANPHLIDELQRHRPGDRILHAAAIAEDDSSAHIFISSKNELSSTNRQFLEEWPGEPVLVTEDAIVPAMRVSQIISDYMAHQPPIFLSIDIEGEDLKLLKDFDFSTCRPALVQVEPSDHFLENNSRDISALMRANAYHLIGRTDVNLIFADSQRATFSNPETGITAINNSPLAEAEREIGRLRERLSELTRHLLP
ncbi:hypothetical protein C0V97_01605 [Asaia sp. W19]|uniref:FkbM family methyltransferase n=1 Tax=unclassified Asaia TaxID=2685023 RepID=UPI000F8F4CD1|nr:FkbM family methyltransferase [Asaia sp. W19]RUT27350.1 hypothetical protein C0V97_01605 [Asaia sp. W19]